MDNNVEVSINILNFNTYEKSKRCIESCLKQKGIRYEIILIDNNSSDDSLERLKKEFGEKIVFFENDDNYGYAKGNNLAIQRCLDMGIQYSLILNSDTEIVGENLLIQLVTIIKKSSQNGIVAPAIYNVTSHGLVLNQNDSKYLKLLRLVGILPKRRKISDEREYISEAQGSALLVSNSLFCSLGGFPEHYYMYCEEGTFCKKVLWNAKNIIWNREEKNYILHHHDKSQRIDAWRFYLMGRNRTLEYIENRDRAKILWTIIFYIEKLPYYLNKKKKEKYKAFILGISTAKKMVRNGASKKEFYEDAKKARNNVKDN